MKLKKFFVCAVAPMAAVLFGNTTALAQSSGWPDRPIRLLVSAPAGGGTDSLARIWAECAGAKLGSSVVVENRPGASGVVAVQGIKRAPADGYTLLLAGMSHMAITPYIFAKQPYDPLQDLEGVSLLVTTPYILAVGPRSRVTSFEALTNLSKSSPGSVNFGSSGIGSPMYLMQAIIAERLGVKFTNVPYQGEAPGMVALQGDQIDVMPFISATALPSLADGRIKAIAVFSEKRLDKLPGVPTAEELLGTPELSHGSWASIVARSGTPAAVVQKIHSATQQCLADPSVIKRYAASQQEVVPAPISAVKEYTLRDTAIWKPIIQKLGIRNE